MGYIAVIGAGSWGTTLASLLVEKGYDVSLWAREKDVADEITKKGQQRLYARSGPACRPQGDEQP